MFHPLIRVWPGVCDTTPCTLLVAVLCMALPAMASTAAGDGPRLHDDEYRSWSGRQIIDETISRHQQFPYVYEEQTMVLMDAHDNRTVRKLRRFSRAEEDGSFKLLLVFDDPEEIRGVALLAVRSGDGTMNRGVYLPAFGAAFKRPRGSGASGNFLGTDFAVEDLAAEDVSEHRYVRGSDRTIEEVAFFTVDAFPRDATVERSRGYGMRRHLVRKDNFVITQTDFFDRRLRFLKRLTRHDLRQVDGPSWRANMVVVNDEQDDHRTLLKVDRRVYSRDYVPEKIFEPEFLLQRDETGGLGLRGER